MSLADRLSSNFKFSLEASLFGQISIFRTISQLLTLSANIPANWRAFLLNGFLISVSTQMLLFLCFWENVWTQAPRTIGRLFNFWYGQPYANFSGLSIVLNKLITWNFPFIYLVPMCEQRNQQLYTISPRGTYIW